MYGFKHVQFIEHPGRPEHPAGVRQGMDTERVYLGVSLAVLISFTTYYAITLFLELCRSIVSIYSLMSCSDSTGLSPLSGSTRMRKASRPLHGAEVSPHASLRQDVNVDSNEPDVDSPTEVGPCNDPTGTMDDYLAQDIPRAVLPPVSDASQLGPPELADLDFRANETRPDASAHSPLLLPAQTPLCTIEECDNEDPLQSSAASVACLPELARNVTPSVEPRCNPATTESNEVHCYDGNTEMPAESGLLRHGTPRVDASIELSYGYPQSTSVIPPPNESLHCSREYVTPLIGADPAESMVTSFNVEGAYSIMHSALLVVANNAGIGGGSHTSGAGADADHDADWTPVGHGDCDLVSNPVDTLVAACGEGGVKEQLSSADILLEDSDSTCATYASSESYFAPPDAQRTEETNPPILLAPPSSPAESSRTPQVALSETTNSHTPLARPFSESIMMDNDYIGPLPKAPRVRVHTPENPDWAVAPDEPVRRPSTSHRSARGEKGKQRKGKDGATEEKKGSGSRTEGKRVARAPTKTSNVVRGQETGPQVRRRSARLVQAQT